MSAASLENEANALASSALYCEATGESVAIRATSPHLATLAGKNDNQVTLKLCGGPVIASDGAGNYKLTPLGEKIAEREADKAIVTSVPVKPKKVKKAK